MTQGIGPTGPETARGTLICFSRGGERVEAVQEISAGDEGGEEGEADGDGAAEEGLEAG